MTIFLTILAILVAELQSRKRRVAAASWILKRCRWLFPLGYVASIFLLIGAFFA